jgi:hypothetical protein
MLKYLGLKRHMEMIKGFRGFRELVGVIWRLELCILK